MPYKAWQLAALEEYGYSDTNEGLTNRVARALAKSDNHTIDTAAFRQACIACCVDPDSFTQSDLNALQKKLNHF